MRGLQVAGELGGHRRLWHVAEQLRPLRQRGGDTRVQRGVLARQQVAVHGLADQRVAEAVHAVGARDEHLVGDRLARSLHHLGGAAPGDRLEQPVRDRPVEHGGGADDRLGRGGQPLDARQQRVAQRRGQQPAVAILGVREQLLGEQRVALGAAVEPVGELRRRGLPQDALELRGELVAVEALERDPLDAGSPLELGEHRAQRVAPVQLVGSVRHDQAERLLARAAHEERDEVARRAVGPVDVLERQQHRAGAAEPLEQREQRLEQAALARARLLVGARADATQLGQQLGERVARARRQLRRGVRAHAARERAQCGHQRRVGDLRAGELQALAEQHARLARARGSSSRSSRVLPTPDSPATNANDGRPAAARSSAPSSSSSSAARPTNVSELTRRATGPIVAQLDARPMDPLDRLSDDAGEEGNLLGTGAQQSDPSRRMLCQGS